jgi:Flp pilus assembly protein TadD
MDTYGMRDVERILKLSPGRVRTMIARGFVRPERGARRAWRFSFQDLVVLRTARALESARIPVRRIHRSLDRLRSRLPGGPPLAGLTILAAGDRVVVREGEGAWLADSGQYVLEIAVSTIRGGLRFVERPVPPVPRRRVGAAEGPDEGRSGGAGQWFERALLLERSDPERAMHAYRRVLALDPCEPAAYVNLGRLLQESGAAAAAAEVYRDALQRCAPTPALLYNLALVLEDLGDLPGAIGAYRRALERDAAYADAHFNLARLYEAADDFRRAIRHLAAYRRLTRDGSAAPID